MKRYIALFCCMMVMFSFSGCGQKNSSSVPEVSLPPASLSMLEEPSDSASNSENAVGLSDPARASAEDLIEPAMEIYSWFALGSMPLSSETRTSINPLTGEEDTFQRVDSPLFSDSVSYTHLVNESGTVAFQQFDPRLAQTIILQRAGRMGIYPDDHITAFCCGNLPKQVVRIMLLACSAVLQGAAQVILQRKAHLFCGAAQTDAGFFTVPVKGRISAHKQIRVGQISVQPGGHTFQGTVHIARCV